MKLILQAIQTRLEQQVPDLKYTDENWGQLDYYYPHPPVKFPAALVDIASVQYSNLGRLLQQGEAHATVTIADLKSTNSSGKAPQPQKDHAWRIYGIIEKVYRALHGWQPAQHASALIRARLERRKNDDGLQLFDLVFTFMIRDTEAKKQEWQKPVTFELEVEAKAV